MEHSNSFPPNRIPDFEDGKIDGQGRLRILLAEDSRVAAMLALHQLRNLDCDVEAVGDGAAAVEAWKVKRHGVVLMDYELPVMDGCEAASGIRRLEGREHKTLIFAVTAHVNEEERARCFAAGMNDVLPKPFRLEQLGAIVRIASPEAAGQRKFPAVSSASISMLREEKSEGELLLALVEIWREDWPVILDDMEKAASAMDGEALATLAHKLKGGAANFGSARVLRRCRAIEELCREQMVSFARSLLPGLRYESAEVQAALDREILAL